MKKLSLKMLFVTLLAVTALTCFFAAACVDNTVPEKPEGPESGVYYLDVGYDEYSLTLSNGDKFALVIDGERKEGIYTLNGEKLDLTFSNQEDGTVSAELKNDVISLTYKESDMIFRKKVLYTVMFDSDGGSSVKTATVVNGKTAVKPADPTKDGYVFIGWFADSEKTVPFMFGTQPVTSDLTVYAKWAVKTVGERSFEVKFDLGYSGAEKIAAMQTVGGALHVLPQPAARSGYAFKGWYFSQTEKADELTYAVDEDTVFAESTTLFASWQATGSDKLEAPQVSVYDTRINWNAVAGMREYVIDIVAPDGKKVPGYDNKRNNGTTTENIDFASLEEGVYVVSVTAIASDSNKNSDTTVRYFTNKALARVSLFEVAEPSMLIFNGVENAEKYFIKVECGDDRHNHAYLDNGNSTNFNFSNCSMKEGGITFTVTATANGYASSVSKVFVVERTLSDIGELKFDAATETVVWNSVPFATEYIVSVNDCEEFSVGSATSLCLKNYAAKDGGIKVKVYPKTASYNSSAAVESKFAKTNLPAPTGLNLDEYGNLSWNAVEGATSYEVKIDNQDSIPVSEGTSIDLSDILDKLASGDFKLTVMAVGATNSLWSDAYEFSTVGIVKNLSYSNGVFTWKPVYGADRYKIKMNDESVETIWDPSETSYSATLREGVNTFAITASDNFSESDWIWSTITVTAYAVNFVNNYGSGVPSQYVAVGDTINLPVASRTNHDFNGWYNVPGGAGANGAKFEDKIFRGSGSITLYADFKPKKFVVQYDFAGGNPTENKTHDVYYREHYKFDVPTTDDGTKAFGGWYSLPNGAGTQYTDEFGNSVAPWSISQETNIAYAFWQDQVLNFKLGHVTGYNTDVYIVSAGNKIDARTEVTIPATYRGITVGMIAGQAFDRCMNLEVLNIPDSIRVISESDPFGSYSGSEKLYAVNVYHVEGNNIIRYGSVDGVLVDYGDYDDQQAGTAIPELKYVPKAKTGVFTIPDGIESLQYRIFYHSKLEEVIIPASVTYIDSFAFYACNEIKTITFAAPKIGQEEKPLELATKALSETGITEITLPKRIASMVINCYGETSNSQTFPSNMTAIHVQNGGSVYSSDDKGAVYNANKTVLLYVPSEISGDFTIPIGVHTIESGAFLRSKINTLTIPNSVTNVKEGALYNASVRKVVFKGQSFNGDVTIGKLAFADNTYLNSIIFEEGCKVTEIGENAFEGCNKLTELVMPSKLKTVKNQAFKDCSGLVSVSFEKSTEALTFGNEVFSGCSKLVSFTLPSNAVNMPDFGGCNSLEEVVVPEDNPNLTSVDGVIYNKQKTEIYYYPKGKTDESFELPEEVETIRYNVFAGNIYLKKVTIGKKVTTIGGHAFEGCINLKEIVFLSGGADEAEAPLEILEYAFANTGFVTLTLPERVDSIGDYALSDMKKLTTLVLNEGLLTIGDYGIYNNPLLTGELVIPATVTEIGAYGLGGNGSLTSVKFADGATIEKLGNYLFYGTNITSFTLPASVREIGDYAFLTNYSYSTGFVSALESFAFESGTKLERIGNGSFIGSKLTSFEVPKTVKLIGEQSFANCANLVDFTFEEGGTENLTLGAYEFYGYDSYNNPEAAIGGTFAYSGITSINIPARVTEIGESGFAGCVALQEVTFEENSKLMYIAPELFAGCNLLTSIVVPKSVGNHATVGVGNYVYNRNAVGESAFAGCEKLSGITFEEGNDNLVTIGSNAFGPIQLRINGSRVSFTGCRLLTSITLPGNLTIYSGSDGSMSPISADSFEDCTSLAAININGTNDYYASYDGIVYTSDFVTVIMCPVAKTSVTLKAETEVIGNGAFSGCSLVESLTIPSTLSVFDNSLLADMVKLSSVTVNGTGGNYSAINNVLYNADASLIMYYPLGVQSDSYEVPASVTQIGARTFQNNKTITTITFADRSEDIEIGEYAFANSAVNSVSLPASLTKLGGHAFEGCSNLQMLTFADGCKITEFNASTFKDCSSLGAIRIPAKITEISDAEPVLNWNDQVTGYNNQLFSGCSSLATITFEEGSLCEKIGTGAFYGMDGLLNVELPDSVKTIGTSAFEDCDNMTSVKLSANLETIEFKAFYGCSKVTVSGETPKLVAIKDQAFYGCRALTDFTFSESLQSIGYKSFYWSGISGNLAFTENLTEVGSQAFASCDGIVSVNIPASIEFKEYVRDEGTSYAYTESPQTFSGCKGLTTVTIEEGVRKIHEGMFQNCEKLANINFPQSLNEFGSSSLRGTAIKEFTLPGQITSLPSYFMYGNKKLTTVTLHENLSSIGNNAFEGCSMLSSITLPDSINSLGTGVFKDCVKLTKANIPELIKVLPNDFFRNCTSLEGLVIPEDMSGLGAYSLAGVKFTTFTLPSKINAVPNGLLMNCSGLTEVVLHSNVTAIGSYAFAGSGLTSITIPAGVTAVAANTFDSCKSLSSITFMGDITSIGDSAFKDCTAFTEFVVPASVTSLSSNAFVGMTAEISVAEDNANYKLVDGAMYSADGQTLLFLLPSVTGTFTIKTGVTVAENAFAGSNVTKVIVESGVTLKRDTLSGGKITEVVLKDGARVERRAFQPGYGYDHVEIATVTVERGAVLLEDALAGMKSTQTVNMPYTQQEASQLVSDGIWHRDWKYSCSATINYGCVA